MCNLRPKDVHECNLGGGCAHTRNLEGQWLRAVCGPTVVAAAAGAERRLSLRGYVLPL